MADQKDDERRGEPRAPIELKVEYKRLNAFFADYTRNISRGGTFIATTKPLPIGTEFLFKLFVPKLDQAIELKGQVKWIVEEGQTDDRAEGPGMGIRFIYADDGERQAVSQLVEQLMTDSLGKLLYSRLMQQAGEHAAEQDSDDGTSEE